MIQGAVAPDESGLWRVYTPDRQPSCSGSQEDLFCLDLVRHPAPPTRLADGDIPIPMRRIGADQLAVSHLVQLASAQPFGDLGALVLGEQSLKAKPQVALRPVNLRLVDEDYLDTEASQFVQQHPLVGVVTCQSVGAEAQYNRKEPFCGQVT